MQMELLVNQFRGNEEFNFQRKSLANYLCKIAAKKRSLTKNMRGNRDKEFKRICEVIETKSLSSRQCKRGTGATKPNKNNILVVIVRTATLLALRSSEC